MNIVSRWPYRLRAFRPLYWLRDKFANDAYDRWLWEQLQDPANVTVEKSYSGNIYRALVSGKTIWAENEGYCDGHLCDVPHKFMCRRSTAIRLQDILSPLRPKIEKPRFVP